MILAAHRPDVLEVLAPPPPCLPHVGCSHGKLMVHRADAALGTILFSRARFQNMPVCLKLCLAAINSCCPRMSEELSHSYSTCTLTHSSHATSSFEENPRCVPPICISVCIPGREGQGATAATPEECPTEAAASSAIGLWALGACSPAQLWSSVF